MPDKKIEYEFYASSGGIGTGGDLLEGQFEIRDNLLIINDENGKMIVAYGCHTVSYIRRKRDI